MEGRGEIERERREKSEGREREERRRKTGRKEER